jgi:hypothetical protein
MIKSENIKCNGMGFAPELSAEVKVPLLRAINERKKHVEWASKREGERYDDNMWCKGSRYHNTERNLNVIVSNACKHIGKENLEEYFSNISVADFRMWIDECLRYSGGADFWYLYEKEWD